MNLPETIQAFVLHFGEMGSRWGINRTLGQVYALLYLSPTPLCADQIVEALGISRSNASVSLKELQSWNLVILKHLPDDRRDFFTTPEDVWQIVRTLAEERKKREVDPTLAVLRDLLKATPEGPDERFAQERMAQMYAVIGQLARWYDDVKGLDTARLAALLAMGSRISRVLEAAEGVMRRQVAKARREGTT